RLLDPPLHEFLPQRPEEISELAESLGQKVDQVSHRIAALHEVNPMLGHRGCRLAVTYPEIYQTQVRAIAEAALAAQAEGVDVRPEIMIPFVGAAGELKLLRGQVEATLVEVLGADADAAPEFLI